MFASLYFPINYFIFNLVMFFLRTSLLWLLTTSDSLCHLTYYLETSLFELKGLFTSNEACLGLYPQVLTILYSDHFNLIFYKFFLTLKTKHVCNGNFHKFNLRTVIAGVRLH